MSGGDREDDDAKAVFAVDDKPKVDEPNDDVPDSAVEVEPEVIAPAPHADLKSRPHHHPPPPPRLREHADERRPLSVDGEPKLARDLMTRQLFTIGPNDTLESLEQQMEAFRFRHLPVVDGNKVVGLISHSDLLHASSSFLSSQAKERDAIIHKVPAARIMRKEMTTVRPTEALAEVAAQMWKARAGCVLVTDDESTLLGIITQGDFVRLAHHYLSREG